MKNLDKIKRILKELDFRLSEKEYTLIGKRVKEFSSKLKKELGKKAKTAEIVIGGSFAKKTVVNDKDKEVDIFVRFKEQNKENEKALLEAVKSVSQGYRAEFSVIHGSRDYAQCKLDNVLFEVVPVLKINKPKEAQNVTDLSAFHVKYVKKKTEQKKLLNEIVLAKKFCKAQGVYGAESYIGGFSGYAIECLIIYYKSFVKMCSELAKAKGQIIIDPEKQYKNKSMLFVEINESKRQNPIVLVDPTWKERNVLAALNNESFNKFVDSAKRFLAKPNKSFFEARKISAEEFEGKKSDGEVFIKIAMRTDRQRGDIAGAKLKKGGEIIRNALGREFDIVKEGNNFGKEQEGEYYLTLRNRKSKLRLGPPVEKEKFVKEFLAKYPNAEKKAGRWQIELVPEQDAKAFLSNWIGKNSLMLKDIGIVDVRVD